MKIELTPLERYVLASIENAGKWDYLGRELMFLLPASIIMALGFHYHSNGGIAAGIFTYAGLNVHRAVRQAKYVSAMKSLIAKLQHPKDDDVSTDTMEGSHS